MIIFVFEDVQSRGNALLGVRLYDDVVPRPGDRCIGALEVVALRQLLASLVDGVVDLLTVDFGHNVKA